MKNILSLIVVTISLPNLNWSDEGMWLFHDPPRQPLREKYRFELSPAWLERVQKASVRFNSGGSGSFVSEDGLILSNHHVGADALQKFGDERHDYLRDGFHARSLAEEKRCLDLELNVLISMEDVTARVNAAVAPGLDSEQASRARRAVMAQIEKESLDQTGLRSDVITLYQGGQYFLYRFKKYTDVRLVFAPEQQIAFFGGDPDNFEYPRYNLDICLFRAYEGGKPARIEHFLKWSATGPREGELVFVSGHPGRTSRGLTVSELEHLRDRQFPYVLSRLHRMEVWLTAYGARSEENARRAKDLFFGVQNSRKAREGMLAGLLIPSLLAGKRSAEQQLRAAVARDPALSDAREAWDRIAAAQKIIAEHMLTHNLLETGHGFDSQLFQIARTLLRAGVERPKPNGERLREFRESNLESLEYGLFSPEPLYDDFEVLRLENALTWLIQHLGGQNPPVQAALAGLSPRGRAQQLVKGTKVKEVAFRQRLYQGGAAAVDDARDPMIELVRSIDAEARAVRKVFEAQEEVKRQAHAKIVRARFALAKEPTYPDATFTLRLAYGTIEGYQQEGAWVSPHTTFTGLYERASAHRHRPPFDLPARWLDRRSRLDLNTPLNFVSTADIIGGNSGSPVVNRAGEFVGIIFDGNLQSLILDFIYTDDQARAISVHARGIIEALRKVYGARTIADELERGKRTKPAARS
jgi:hypothetical protein